MNATMNPRSPRRRCRVLCVWACALLLMMALYPASSLAQTDEKIKTSVDDLVHKHYMDGIPYAAAHALGPAALPYLFELLGNPEEKLFWVNIIVTTGFLENSSAIDPLVAFLENTQGEVDSFTFRALLSVPYALGCIAANQGDAKAFQYLADNLETPLNQTVRWSYRSKPVDELIAEQSVMGLAVSGQPEARILLLDLKDKIAKKTDPKSHALSYGNIGQALAIIDRIATEGRSAVLNPQRE